MNILTLYDSRRASGQVSRLKKLIFEYASNGHTVHYIASEQLFKIEHSNIKAHLIKIPFKQRKGFLYWTYITLMMTIYFYWLAFRYLPRTVIFFETFYSLLCYLPCTLIRARKVLFMRAVVFRRDSEHESSAITRFYRKSIDFLGLFSASLIIAPTEWMRSQLLTKVPFINQRVHVLPYATSLPSGVKNNYNEGLRQNSSWLAWLDGHDERKKILCQNYDIPEKSLVVALSGRRAKKEDIIYFLKTMAALESDRLTLIVYGDQKEKLNLLTTVTGLGLNEQVIFSGSYFVDNTILLGADLFLHSSGEEGMSTDLLEALGSGIGVIAMETQEMKEILVHPECLLPKRNVGECGVKLANFINNRESIQVCKRLSQQRAVSYSFNWPKKALELLQ